MPSLQVMAWLNAYNYELQSLFIWKQFRKHVRFLLENPISARFNPYSFGSSSEEFTIDDFPALRQARIYDFSGSQCRCLQSYSRNARIATRTRSLKHAPSGFNPRSFGSSPEDFTIGDFWFTIFPDRHLGTYKVILSIPESQLGPGALDMHQSGFSPCSFGSSSGRGMAEAQRQLRDTFQSSFVRK